MIWRLALIMIVTPAMGDDFADRWPQPIAVDPIPVIEQVGKPVRHAHAEQRGVCLSPAKLSIVGIHRYWRCKALRASTMIEIKSIIRAMYETWKEVAPPKASTSQS